MASPVKLDLRPLSLGQTAEQLGISPSRAEEINKIVESDDQEELSTRNPQPASASPSDALKPPKAAS